jgi:hypothetical protein
MNNRDDFAPQIRNAAWWASDSRQAANGRGNQQVMIKLGLLEAPDLSGIEAVQMGHVMQPVIGRLAQDKLKIELKDADYMLTHPKESWFKSHFDFISADGKHLVEAKNYNAAVRSKFDADANIIPSADMAQLIHEAAVHNVNRITLAVLFGGQNFETYTFDITAAQKEQLIKDMAVFWAAVVSKTPLEPETTDQAKLVYRNASETAVTASRHLESEVQRLRAIRTQIKALEAQEEASQAAVMKAIGTASELLAVDGTVLATWRQAKPSKKFNSELFKQSYGDLYQQFVVDVPGTRRFLIK